MNTQNSAAKNISKLLLVLMFTLPFSYARASSDNVSCCNHDTYYNGFSIEAQTAAFFPLSSTIRHIYGSALPMFTLAVNWWFQKSWAVWLDSSYVFGNGHATGFVHESTHLSFVPITAGLKYFYRICNATDLYAGFGPSYSFLYTVDRSQYVHRHTSANSFGFTVKTGVIYYFKDWWFVQGFFNYMYQKMHFHRTESDPFVVRRTANLSSLQLGAGAGLKF